MAHINKASADAGVIEIAPEAVGLGPLLPSAGLAAPAASTYLLLPIIYLTVTLLGGLRLNAGDNAFIFIRPALICLILAAVMMVLIFRSGLITLDGWLSQDREGLANGANALILLTLFCATVQVLNSLMPERGLPFWIIAFCFLWTLWNNLFAEFETKRLLRSLAALFSFAFVTKYLILANLTGASDGNWLQRMIENPGKEAFTWLLDLPRYSAGTGYIQFFTLALYLIGLYLTPRSTRT
jgi:hypothetical protein